MKPMSHTRIGHFALAGCAALSLIAVFASCSRTKDAATLQAAATHSGGLTSPSKTKRAKASSQTADATPISASTTGIVAGNADDVLRLRARGLALPVSAVSAAQLTDNYTHARSAGATHQALDIMAPRGTPVLAVEDGRVTKLFSSKAGGITLYQFDPAAEYVYYYAHLDRYADGILEGHNVTKGQIIGYVGSTGNAAPNAPHLHFAVSRLGPERQWWRGTPINPFLIWRNAKP